MAYIFDPIRNTFVDDEDTSLGNKLALNDEEFEELLKIPGVFRASEAMQPPPRQEVLDREAINRFIRDNKAEGGMIGGGVISGEDYGNRTGFVEPKLIVGGSRTPLEFRGMFGVRTNATVPTNTPGYLGKSGEQAVFATKTDAQRFINEDLDSLIRAGRARFTGYSKEYTKSLEDIKSYVKSQGGPSKLFLSDLVEMFGDPTETETGRDAKTEARIKKALGNDYNKLIKGGEQLKTTQADKIKFNKLVLDVNRGDLPILALGSDSRGTTQNIKKFLTEANKKRFDKLLPKLRAINSRISQPRQKYTTEDIQTISETTTKTFNKMEKKYPAASLDRGYLLKTGKSFNDKSYILSQIDRHIGEGGNLYKHVSGDTYKNIKFRNNQTGKLITYNNIDITNPEFKEAADRYNEVKKLRNIKIDDPRNPDKTITLDKALQEGGDKIVLDHLDEVGKNPLKKLVITNQKANLAGQIKGLTQNEIDAIGRGQNLSFVDNIKRYKKYAERILTRKAADPDFKIKSPTETIKEKTGTFRGEAQAIKSKMDNFRSLTSRVPGGAVVLSPVDFTLSMFAGLPLTESLASAGSYLLKDPLIGKTVNIPLAIAQDMQDPDKTFERAQERQGKFKDFLEGVTGIDQDEPFASELREKLLNMEAGDQPDIDPFQAAEGGRAGFSNGGATGMSSDEFVKELEYYFTNPDADLPKATTFRETMNPIEILNDMIDPRNYPYIADRLAKTGIRIGEFGLRVLPAVGKLIGDITTKPSFKVQGKTGTGYIQDYDQMPKSAKIKGTGIFSEFLDNLIGTEMTEGISRATGLDDLIKMEDQKMKDRRTTVGPKVLADTLTLGMEFTAPIFPGLKLLKSYAKARNLPVDDTTKQLLEKEIKDTLDKNGISRRDFMKTAGAGASLVIAKMLGFGDEFTKATKVVRPTVEQTATGGVPPYFFELVKKIKKSGRTLEPEFDPRVENNMQLGDYVMRENTSTGEISIQKVKEGGMNVGDEVMEGTISEETITYKPGEFIIGADGKPVRTADEYEEFTTKPDINDDGKMKDVEPGLDSIEEIIELMPNQLKMSDLEAAGYNVNAFPDNIKQLLIDDLQKID